jgi:hypothetical protein
MNIIALRLIGLSVVTSDEPYYWVLQHWLLLHADRMLQIVQNTDFSSEDSITLNAVNNLGALYTNQGRL